MGRKVYASRSVDESADLRAGLRPRRPGVTTDDTAIDRWDVLGAVVRVLVIEIGQSLAVDDLDESVSGLDHSNGHEVGEGAVDGLTPHSQHGGEFRL